MATAIPVRPPGLARSAAESGLDLFNIINLKNTNPSAQMNYQQALQAFLGPNVSAIKWYSDNMEPPIDPNTTVSVQELSDLASWYYQQFIMLTDVGVIRQYYTERFQAAITGLYLAKSSNGVGGTFGLGSSGTLHAQQIRPESVLDNTGSPTANVTSWSRSVTQGWNTTFFSLNTQSTATTLSPLQNTNKQVNFLVWGFIDQSYPSKVQAFKVIGPGSVGYGVETVNILNLANQISVIPAPAAIYVDNNKVWSIDVEFNAAGNEVIALDGIQFVNTAYYQQE